MTELVQKEGISSGKTSVQVKCSACQLIKHLSAETESNWFQSINLPRARNSMSSSTEQEPTYTTWSVFSEYCLFLRLPRGKKQSFFQKPPPYFWASVQVDVLPLFGGRTWYVKSLMTSLKSSRRRRSIPVEAATRTPSVEMLGKTCHMSAITEVWSGKSDP